MCKCKCILYIFITYISNHKLYGNEHDMAINLYNWLLWYLMGNNNICKYELLLRISSSFLLFYIPVDRIIYYLKKDIYLPGIRLTHRTIVESHTPHRY